MDFPRLTFPLTVDFGSAWYWIGDVGPFKYGAAVTAFFCDGDLTDNVGDGLLLMRRLEEVLKSFGGHLHPYVREQPVNADLFLGPEQSAVECSFMSILMPRLRFLRSLGWNRIRKWDCCPNCDYKIDVCLQLWLYIWLSCPLISASLKVAARIVALHQARSLSAGLPNMVWMP